jgi:3',5'-cyclic-AMP phosphodiesterase
MLIAHISDFHIFADQPETSLVRLDAVSVARKVVADIAAFTPAIDAVMFTGDLTDGGSTADYALLRDILAPLTMPVFVVPGNHDKRAGLRAAFAQDLPFGSGPWLDYVTDLSDLRIIGLDTLREGQVAGALDHSQLDWLAGLLRQNDPRLTLILMHHPAFPSHIDTLDAMSLLDGRDALAALIAAYQGPLRILSGHIHRPYQTLWQGKFCAVGGSPVFQLGLELRKGQPEPGPVDAPYHYFLHQIDGADAVTIHNRYVAL